MKASYICLKQSRIGWISFCSIFFLLLMLPVNLFAATLTVTTTADSGAGSLRQTILDAASGDSIDFDATAFPDAIIGEIILSSELLVDKNLTINGGGNVTLNGNDSYRVILVDNNDISVLSVTLDGLNFINGYADDGIAGYSIFDDGGAILNLEDVTISNSSFDSNSSGSNGGAVANVYKCTIVNSSFTANSTGNNGGAIHHVLDELTLDGVTVSGNTANAFGGGLYTELNSTTDITNSNFSSNNANDGGAIAVYSIMNITGTTLIDNTASNSGGGMYAAAGTVSINDSSVTHNTAGQGGGIFFYSSSTTATISNSTFSSNTASSGSGLFFFQSTGTVSNSTIASNVGDYGIKAQYATVNLISSIVADNHTYDVNQGVSSIITADHCLIENQIGHFITDGVNSNIVGHDPKLGPLKNYGGSTESHVLLNGSPAIDAGSNPDSLSLDQRGTGYARVVDGTIDMGALENTYNSTFSTLTVTNTNDTGAGSLRQIIADATTGDTIVFDGTAFPNATTGTITLSSGEIAIDKVLTITGGGKVTIDANNSSRIFNIDDGIGSLVNVVLSGLVLTNGDSSADTGGAILNKENTTLSNSTVSNNTTTGNGGGLYNDSSALMAISNCTISNNTAQTGAGLYHRGASLDIDTTTLIDNTASSCGGAMYATTGTVSISDSSVTYNTAVSCGGGIAFFSSSTTATISNSTFSSNTASSGSGLFFSKVPVPYLILPSHPMQVTMVLRLNTQPST